MNVRFLTQSYAPQGRISSDSMGTVDLGHILELADTSGVASNWSNAKPMCDH